jgi:hypothetical protein
MFYTNLGYRWIIYGTSGEGTIQGAWGVNSVSALSREGRDQLPPAQNRFFDPQLYLAGLDLDDCDRAVARLATYKWVNPEVDAPSDGESLSDWEDRIARSLAGRWPLTLPTDSAAIDERVGECLAFQQQFGVRALILPGPLTSDPESDYSVECGWIDSGLGAVRPEWELPALATVALSDTCLTHRPPERNELLQAIVDQVAARPVSGVYLLLHRAAPTDTPYILDGNVARSLLSLCHDFGARAGKTVLVNYVDVFGLACIAVGATGFATGPTSKARRLCFSDFASRGGGGPLPRLYSHSLLMDLLTERDLEHKLAAQRLLRLIEGDETPESAALFAALRQGTPVSALPDWQERVNNVRASSAHFQVRVENATRELAEAASRPLAALNWLQDAERNAAFLSRRFDDDPLTADDRHPAVWCRAFEETVDRCQIAL